MAANVQFFDADGFTTITLEDLADVLAGANTTPRKAGFRSISDRPLSSVTIAIGTVVGNDGAAQLRLGQDASSSYPSVSAPWTFAAALGAAGAGGVWGALGVYGYKITALTALGESAPASEVTVNVDVATKKVTLTWVQTPLGTGYKIYRSATAGTYGATTLLTTIGSGATITFLDDGSATGAGTPPSANTTGGWIATPTLSAPAAGGLWGAIGVRFWRVVAYDGTGIEIANTLEATIDVDDTSKTVTLTWPAVATAGSFKVFRSTASGIYTTPALRATLASGSTNYVDNGDALVAGTVTTPISYGVPPALGSFGAGALTTGSSLAIGQEVLFWMTRIVPLGTPELGNPRQANIEVQET